MSADYQVHADVAVITLNNPPVNGLGFATRQAIVAGLEQAQADAAVKAIVITGAGKAFSGGADIREFNSPKMSAEPTLHSLIRMLESSPKPAVAAVRTGASSRAGARAPARRPSRRRRRSRSGSAMSG